MKDHELFNNLMGWLAKKNMECTETLFSQNNLTNEQFANIHGYQEALQDMRARLLFLENPYNREDIQRAMEEERVDEPRMNLE